MSDINWQDGEVCYANGRQWCFNDSVKPYKLVCNISGTCLETLDGVLDFGDFQLNEIREGDFTPASELDTEQKCNEVFEVFGLFGAKNAISYKSFTLGFCNLLLNGKSIIVAASNDAKQLTRQLTYHQIIAIGKLKRMMLEREKSAPKTTPNLTTDFTKVSSKKYEREITDRQGNSATVDVYDVLKAFNVTCPATQHAVKKLLCSGLRGHKDLQTDLIEAKESIVRAIELN